MEAERAAAVPAQRADSERTLGLALGVIDEHPDQAVHAVGETCDHIHAAPAFAGLSGVLVPGGGKQCGAAVLPLLAVIARRRQHRRASCTGSIGTDCHEALVSPEGP